VNQNAIETAFGQRLASLANVPAIAWQNADFDPLVALPYLEFVHAPVARVDEVIDGGFARQIGIVLITVVSERGKFTTGANALAESIADYFPKALRLPLSSGGNAVINAPAEVVQGFTDGVYWRVPVRVSYVTESDETAYTPWALEFSGEFG
jgi:hypothetical protein